MADDAAQSWLELQCRAISGAIEGLIVRGGAENPSLAARWPGGAREPSSLLDVARIALAQQRPVVEASARRAEVLTGATDVAVPFSAGVVAICVARGPTGPETDYKPLIDLLGQGADWLLAQTGQSVALQRQAAVLEIAEQALAPDDLASAATAVATQLAAHLSCELVSVGLCRHRRVHLVGLSHSAEFNRRSRLVAEIEAAMDEAVDQDAVVVYPPCKESGPARVTLAHERLVRERGASAVWSVPLASAGRVVGAVTFELPRVSELAPGVISFCEQACGLLGPVLDLKRRVDERWFQRVRSSVRTHWTNLVGSGHPKFKLAVAACAACLLFLSLAAGDYRITANATLEGRVQRAIVAGLDGYITEANARGGDLVKAGQILGRLDDGDLLLEHRDWSGRRAQLDKQQRSAFARHDRSEVNILRAQIEQADAQLALIEAQLARTRFVAPFDGIIVRGDLSQSLGSPVQRGDLLFEIAPLDGYRIILEIDQRDIADAVPGQEGQLALAALPGQTLPLTVQRVTPVSIAEEGRNYFRVEALLDEPVPGLRPGMEGVAKIAVDRRPLVWIWTHRLTDWLRLWVWSWLP